jgi:transposase
MAYNFRNYDWDQLFLFPPDIRDWLPQDHLVWFITEIVSRLDLEPFYSRYNPEGDGRPAYHPAMMTVLYFYSYCCVERSSRKIERLCMESVPYRVVSGGLQPDHTTISRFRKKFASELSALFLQIIALCRRAGLCTLDTVSLDGTKIVANASLSA